MKLTQQDFLLSLDCPRHLWAKINDGIEPPQSKFKKYLGDQKIEVKKLAQEFLEMHTLQTYPAKSTLQSNVEIATETLSAKVDFLITNSETNEVDLYICEIGGDPVGDKKKRLKAAFQKKIASANFTLNKIFFIHLNKFYKRREELDILKLIKITDPEPHLAKPNQEIDDLIDKALQIFELDNPDSLPINCRPKYCHTPQICFPDFPNYSVFELKRASDSQVKAFLREGITEITDIPDDAILKPYQKKQVFVAKKGQPDYNIGNLKSWLNNLEFPLYFLDYETFMFLLPQYEKTKSGDQIVFQYSLHIMDKAGNLSHSEFLHTDKSNPAEKVFQNLQKDIGKKGSIIVWNASFEKGRNRELGLQLEQEEFFTDLNNRTFDLGEPFANQDYEHPDFKGSWSIKNVLPVLAPDLSYKDLNIGNGEDASLGWFEAVHKGQITPQIEKDLLEYCKLDTLAMVRIYEFLIQLVKEKE